jgi:hypothetical protein
METYELQIFLPLYSGLHSNTQKRFPHFHENTFELKVFTYNKTFT